MNDSTPSVWPSQRIAVPRDQAGFTLAELAISSLISVMVLLAAFMIFDVNSRVSRVQTQISDMQQSQRIAQQEMMNQVRMAGRGGLPAPFAINVDNNVSSGTFQVGGNTVVDQTDVLTVRGVFSAPIYQINSATGFAFNSGTQSGTVTVDSLSPGGIAQPMQALQDALAGGGVPEAMLIVSPTSPLIYAVVELQGGNVNNFDVDGNGTTDPGELRATLNFSANPGSGTHNAAYLGLSPGGAFPATLTTAAVVGLLKEYQYYIRDDQTALGGNEPKLSRAQFFPNTNVPYAGTAANSRVDIADNVMDLQVTIALDANSDRVIDVISAPESDEWLFNHGNDAETDDYWGFGDADAAWSGATPFQLRLTTVVRTEVNDPGYQSEPLDWVENHEYAEPAQAGDLDEQYERAFRRRIMQTIVDLRNIS